MGEVRLERAAQDFGGWARTRISQGGVSVGPDTQGTFLRSCVCVGVYHAERRIGGISHITGFREEAGHFPAGALRLLRQGLKRYGLRLEDCECFLIGGAQGARHVYDATVAALEGQGIRYRSLDVLGGFHRKLAFDPAAGVVTLFKKEGNGRASPEAFTADKEMRCFDDPKRRLLTGASLFFRNKDLLAHLTGTVLPALAEEGKRFHVWCAGCSTGMEVYSIAMCALSWMRDKGGAARFRILGSDVSPLALEAAERGVYSVNENHLKSWKALLERYTERQRDGKVRVNDELRAATVFRQRDIREGSRSHRFEFVVCDHVLQYFEAEEQFELLDGLAPAVAPGGYLYVSTPLMQVRDAIPRRYPFRAADRCLFLRER